ncbi:hypothetical protein O181_107895 [Austropuccinia psidii MF-1]|uniref:Uncharacterized protein n=1 Tax=Austropuccinia psidii MF-1 TaxID=1389203 RepID=A0A9Q3JVE5_9BASI|nr:hypothetical protein [Austropuccinia psidii MF-1]
MEEPFAHPTPLHSIIIIDNMPIGFPPPRLCHLPLLFTLHPLLPWRSLPLPPRTQPPPPPIPTMRLARNSLAWDQH